MDDQNPKREIWESNRDVAKRPKLGTAYCHGCDACLVPDGAKCENCGTPHNRKKKRYKKI